MVTPLSANVVTQLNNLHSFPDRSLFLLGDTLQALIAAGSDLKQSVRTATTANITLSGAQTIDGVGVVAGDRVLVKNQTTASQNGIYVAAAGAWTRATNADEDAELTSGTLVPVEGGGTLNGGTLWILSTAPPIVVGTTGLTFVLVGPRREREVIFPVEWNSNRGDYRTRSIAGTGQFRFVFQVPADFVSLVYLRLVLTPRNASLGSVPIDLSSDYGADGESNAIHSQSNIGSTFPIPAAIDTYGFLNLASVFTSLAAGDNCGVLVDHQAIGGTLDYYCIRLRYNLF